MAHRKKQANNQMQPAFEVFIGYTRFQSETFNCQNKYTSKLANFWHFDREIILKKIIFFWISKFAMYFIDVHIHSLETVARRLKLILWARLACRKISQFFICVENVEKCPRLQNAKCILEFQCQKPKCSTNKKYLSA